MRGSATILMLVVAAIAAGALPARAAQRRFFSFDPADAATRAAAGALTFEFDQHLFSTHVIAIRATEGEATADLQHVGEASLGPGGLDHAAGGHTDDRDLYRIKPDKEGGAMVSALCPGAKEGWVALPRIRADRDLVMLVIGRNAGGAAHLCHRLAFTFHGEWRLPPGPGVNPNSVPQPHFPY
ncbi:MAG TPA: hypothetical protein VGS12_06490 [Caulobacteraceae bacterium]|nr:hypothetical protein [Caulobacteraceae bacterium]